MALSLLDLAAYKVAENYNKGKYLNKDFKLSSEISNIVFKKFKEHFDFNSDEAVASMGTQMTLTHYGSSSYKVGPLDPDFLKTQNSLEVVKIGTVEYICRVDYESNKHQLIKTVEMMITSDSRKSLKSLTINSARPNDPNWTLKLGKMLPSLTHLNLATCEMNNRQFDLMTEAFPNLLTLDITGCKITTLKGISRLNQLQGLIMGIVRIESKEGFEELCELESLRVLDLSTDENFRAPLVIEHLSTCIEEVASRGLSPLPNLVLLDATQTDIEYPDYQTFCSYLKNLRQIRLTGTPLHDAQELSTFRIEAINCGTLESSIKALRTVFNSKHVQHVETVVSTIATRHLSAIDGLVDMDQRRELIEMTSALIPKNRPDILLRHCSVIWKRVFNSQTLQNFTFKDISLLIRTYCKHSSSEMHVEFRNQIFSDIWSIFSHEMFLHHSKLMEIGALVKEGLQLGFMEDNSPFIRLVYKFFENVLRHPEYSDRIVTELKNGRFLTQLHSPNATSVEEYLAKLNVTMAAVQRSRLICQQFKEMKGAEVFKRERAQFEKNLNVNAMQLEIKKIVQRMTTKRRENPVRTCTVAKRRRVE